MKIEVEMEEVEREDEFVEIVSSLGFFECTRKDLEELGKFFLAAAQSLPTPRIRDNKLQVSSAYLAEVSDHFKDHETRISVHLGRFSG